jgi:hypothetical protein
METFSRRANALVSEISFHQKALSSKASLAMQSGRAKNGRKKGRQANAQRLASDSQYQILPLPAQ